MVISRTVVQASTPPPTTWSTQLRPPTPNPGATLDRLTAAIGEIKQLPIVR